jgi:ubiquinol-cytochrome c reductase cytochrome c subunit
VSRFVGVLRVLLAAGVIGLVAVLLAGPGLVLGDSTGAQPTAGSADPARVAAGRALFVSGCSSCHGFQAQGIQGVAPSLRGVGAQAADFYLSTGRMPLEAPDEQPQRAKPAYAPTQIAALDAYIGSFGGPPVPHVSARGSSLSVGQQLFADNCSGCHQASARGGTVTGAFVPSLLQATPQQVVEAARIGPYLMPRFGPGELSDADLAAIAGYIQFVKAPPDRGGWGIGHIGPVAEGIVVWFAAIPLLLLITRLIGERTER